MITRNRQIRPDDKITQLFISPHYLHDNEWKQPKTIWGSKADCIHFEYSDRLCYERKKAARKLVFTFCRMGTAEYYEWLLRYYYRNRNIELVCIMAGVNLARGYPYLIFGFKDNSRTVREKMVPIYRVVEKLGKEAGCSSNS